MSGLSWFLAPVNHFWGPALKSSKFVKVIYTLDIKRQLCLARVSQSVPVSGLGIKRFYEIWNIYFPSKLHRVLFMLCKIMTKQW